MLCWHYHLFITIAIINEIKIPNKFLQFFFRADIFRADFMIQRVLAFDCKCSLTLFSMCSCKRVKQNGFIGVMYISFLSSDKRGCIQRKNKNKKSELLAVLTFKISVYQSDHTELPYDLCLPQDLFVSKIISKCDKNRCSESFIYFRFLFFIIKRMSLKREFSSSIATADSNFQFTMHMLCAVPFTFLIVVILEKLPKNR